MAPEQFARFTTRRPLHFTGLIVVVGAFLLVLAGPRVWARGQINLFGLELARVWTEDTLRPTQNACLPGAGAEIAQFLQARLQRAGRYDSHLALHWGAVACLQGDLQQAEVAWSAGVVDHQPDPMMSMFAAVVAYADRQMIETPHAEEFSKYGFNRCVQLDQSGDIPEAVGWCEFSFAYTPGKTVAGKLASLYEKLGEESSAQEVWQRLQETVASNSPDYWWALGKAAEQEKDWLVAADAYQRAAALEDGKDAFRHHLRAGLMWLRAQDVVQAELAYQKALTLNPDKVDAYLGLGNVYRSQKQYEEAVRWYEKAQEVAPENPSPPYQFGLVSRAQGDYEEALIYFDRSLVLRADNPGVLYYKAVTLGALGRQEMAIAMLEQAVAAHQNPPEHWTALLAQWRGD